MARPLVLAALLLLSVLLPAAHAALSRERRLLASRPRLGALHPKYATQKPANVRGDLISQCEEKWRNATLDHFNWGAGDLGLTTFKQRYFVCGNNWGADDDGKLGPIFFYLGNEANVLLYLNNSGLMWESAPEFRALLVFAEHRYYGESVPYASAEQGGVKAHMRYLGAEQAMADYAELIMELKHQLNASESQVIGFGGSYGGMLAAWMRMKYPHVLDGAVAASAPIWNFEGETPAFDPLAFAKGVTWDATPHGGAASGCAENVRDGWKVLARLGASASGRATIARAVGLCDASSLKDAYDALELRNWLSAAWDFMAMGNFPYASGYILNGQGQLPAFPVRVACDQGLGTTKYLEDEELIRGLARAAGVYYNNSGSLKCVDFQEDVNPDTEQDGNFWDYQYCTEMFMPFARDGESDMFWPEPWRPDEVAAGCQEQWGVTPRRLWAETQWGGRRIGAASHIVFSNGLLDPWHGGGVLREVNDDLPTLVIPEGAHHLDLMFTHPDDPQSVTQARQAHRQLIRKWIQLARKEGGAWRPASGGRSAGHSHGHGMHAPSGGRGGSADHVRPS